MKIVILAGGTRSTISNEQEGIPKPMVEIGGKPLLWHVMKSFSEYGFKEFIICGGYKVNLIKEYFMDYYIYQSDITVNLQDNTIEVHKNRTEDWRVTVVDTGLYSATGQRVAQIQNYIEDENFILTYGDCLSDINVSQMYDYHIRQGTIATMAVARPTGRNKSLEISPEGFVMGRQNSAEENQAWTNACLFAFNRKIFHILNGNYELESFLIKNLVEDKQLTTYRHEGFWTPVETYRDRVNMENLWNAGIAPWIKNEMENLSNESSYLSRRKG